MKRVIVLIVALTAVAAFAEPHQAGFFGPDSKAAEQCEVAFSWGRGFLSDFTLYPPQGSACAQEWTAATRAFEQSPPVFWWDVVPRPPEGAPDGVCFMALAWTAGSPGNARPTFSTRIMPSGAIIPTQPGCVADAQSAAALALASSKAGVSSPKRLPAVDRPR